jgi:amino acid adenylation domain-containing protein/non-ribosomal peptide synthase protein (TIGR01720 family)
MSVNTADDMVTSINGTANGTANGNITGKINGKINGTANGAANGNGTINGKPAHKQGQLLPRSQLHELTSLRFEIADAYGFDFDAIEDIYPCMPMQLGLLSLASRKLGNYTLHARFDLNPEASVERFRKSWEEAHRSTAILRTRMVHHPSYGYLQVVLREELQWIEVEHAGLYVKQQEEREFQLGESLCRYAFVQGKNGQSPQFIWTVHHAQLDGWGAVVLTARVSRLYHGLPCEPPVQIKSYIEYIEQQNVPEAENYWRQAIDGSAVQFPASVTPGGQPAELVRLEYQTTRVSLKGLRVKRSALLYGAWALVVKSLTGADAVVFGTVLSGRRAAMPKVKHVIGPTIASVPVQVNIDQDQRVAEYLASIEQENTRREKFSYLGLANIAKINASTESASKFGTIITVQAGDEFLYNDPSMGEWKRGKETMANSSYSLNMEFYMMNEHSTKMVVEYDPQIFEESTVKALLVQTTFVMEQLGKCSDEDRIRDITMVSPEDQDQLWTWNRTVPSAVERCLHDLIEEQARARPDAPAVCAWDGELTYGELNNISTQLAHHLVKQGLQPGTVVPLCFEKSLWVTVAVLAVLKAGAAFVMLDPKHPDSRLRFIVEQTDARLTLSSVSCLARIAQMAPQALAVGSDQIPEADDQSRLPVVSPSSPMYVIFTSGSTGTPKGALVSHQAFCSNIHYQAAPLGYHANTRVFNFAANVFDVFVYDTGMTLATGGCICTPSEHDRQNNLPGAIRAMKATLIIITPSVARLLDPRELPSLKTYVSGGEAMTLDVAQKWSACVDVVNTYGPSECTPNALVNARPRTAEEVMRLGKGAGAVPWIVDPSDHNKLVPVGAVGELLLEGPLLGLGYLKDPERTASTYIHNPAWLVAGTINHPGRHGVLYKTGDLVRYNTDGSLIYMGRKDTQVKLHGQRVELGEVEHHVRECVPEAQRAEQLAAEIVQPSGDGAHPLLAVFMSVPNDKGRKSESLDILTVAGGIEDLLAERLPSYMVPTLYFTIARLPMTITGKTDRKQLRELVASLSVRELADLRSQAEGEKRMPSTAMEKRLQELWARVLHIDVSRIGVDDSFFQLGGDSIIAMNLVGEGRKADLSLSVMEIFRHPRLAALAKHVSDGAFAAESEAPILPFSLMDRDFQISEHAMEIASFCQVERDQIEDVYPCTPLQQGLLALTSKQQGDYLLQAVLTLSPDVDLPRFCAAWEQAVLATPILRTRIIQLEDRGLVQVVVKAGIEWTHADSLDDYIKSDLSTPIELGQPLTRYAVGQGPTDKWFAWTLHHAVYDGVSLPLILNLTSSIYHGTVAQPPTDIRTFVKFIGTRKLDEGARYWHKELADYDSVPFPSPTSQTQLSVADSTIEHLWEHTASRSDTTLASLVRAAWAIVAYMYTGTPDVVFGATVSGRSAPVFGIETIAAPTIATVPVRVKLQPKQPVSEYLQAIQDQATEMIPFEQVGLQEISNINSNTRAACNFQTLLVVQPPDEDSFGHSAFGQWKIYSEEQSFSTYAITMNCFISQDGIKIVAVFDANVISHQEMKNVIDQFSHVMHQLADATAGQTIKDIATITPKDKDDIWMWNATVPPAVDSCFMDLVQKQVNARPDAPAVCAWDGKLTYQEMDELSSKLAYHLIRSGVKPQTIVPLCFEKSMWTPVAVLAVLKAGSAFLILDPTLPEGRLSSVVAQARAEVVLSSESSYQLSSRLVSTAIPVGPGSLPERIQPTTLPQVDSESPMYVVFTSGSTGVPKGAVISHRAMVSATLYQSGQLGFGPTSRLYDFASYAYDVSVSNITNTLANGGCLCVPSEQARKNDLESSFCEMGANIMELTPSVVNVLDMSRLTGLRVLILGGEAVRPDDLRAIPANVRVINTYGPAECTPTTVLNLDLTSLATEIRIGRGAGVATWVADPADHNKLVPLGTVGELLLEGPLVGLGYLNNPDQTAAVFIRNPQWLLDGTPTQPGRQGVLYKTGDLVRYNMDGSLSYIGRKDTQVKIRGQRVELGEVEYYVQKYVPEAQNAEQVVAEVIVPSGEQASPLLAVFLSIPEEEFEAGAENAQGGLTNTLAVSGEVEDLLAEHLASYMVPSVYFTLPSLPMTVTGKTDRGQLRAMAASISVQQLADLRSKTQGQKNMPSNETEKQMQQLWAGVLNINAASIGLDDNFFRLGGDSITAMKLVSQARAKKLVLSVMDIFRHPRLGALAQLASNYSPSDESQIAQFSLIGTNFNWREHGPEVLASCYKVESVEDAYPCTPLQEGLLAITSKQQGSYLLQSVLKLSPDIDMDRFRTAWEQTVQALPILRTRVIQHKDFGLLQVVVKDRIAWIRTKNLENYLKEEISSPIELGHPLARYALIEDMEREQSYFVWTLHHAIYDGGSLPLILDVLNTFYTGRPSKVPTDIRPFIRFLLQQNRERSRTFWMSELSSYNSLPFPSPSSIEQPMADQTIEHVWERVQTAGSSTTLATLVRAAWAIVAYTYTGMTDVVFGATVSGRSAPVVGIETIVAPTIATVPVRVRIDPQQTIASYLQNIQDQATEMIPFEQTGLQEIARFSDSTKAACDFQTLLVVQPPDEDTFTESGSYLGQWEVSSAEQAFSTYAITLNCFISQENVKVVASFDSRIISSWQMTQTIKQFCYTMQLLAETGTQQTLAEVATIMPDDKETIWKWNSTVPPAKDCTVHALIDEQVKARPDAQAVCAWDGNLTYNELDRLSADVAHRLLELGVQVGMIVPLCFKKSMWTTVAMLGVLKAGAAFLMLDPTHPETRLRSIIQQAGSKLLLSSSSCYSLGTRLAEQVLEIGPGSISKTSGPGVLPYVPPKSPLYVVFTSGSTGTPKGVLVSHGAMSSNIQYQAAPLGFEPGSRVFDFANYIFDVFLYDHVVTLATGGCICVPTDSDRNNPVELANAMASMESTLVLLTPTVARLLDPTSIPSLKTLIFGGEASAVSDVERWWPYVSVFNTYGPSECTTNSLINSAPADPKEAVQVGKGAGTVTWVVDPNDHNKLMPLGTIGELLLEGPLLGLGYLNRPKQTAAAFIHDPQWLTEGFGSHPGRSGTLYRTGDLVRYNENGNLSHMGRKDTQVKIRGQRVELGEVEHQVRECLKEAKDAEQVVAEVIVPSGESATPLLAVFLSAGGQPGPDGHKPNREPIQVLKVSTDVDDKLSERLPSYMVPKAYFSLAHLPMTGTGKTDRMQLRALAAGFSSQQLAELRTQRKDEKRQPSTEVEKQLQQLWARVLNIEATSIGLDDSFLRLGGDSITAMQISSGARQLQLRISTGDILQKKTIARLAAEAVRGPLPAGPLTTGSGSPETLDQPFGLTPIQELYLGLQDGTTGSLDQCFFLRINKRISFQALSAGISAVVQRHSMLRARLCKNSSGRWEQYISGDVGQSFILHHIEQGNEASVIQVISDCRTALDPEHGPNLTAALFDTAEPQYLFLAAHHLVIDLVSWRVLLQDLENWLLSNLVPESSSLSFQSWQAIQTESAKQLDLAKALPFDVPPVEISFWGIESPADWSGHSETETFVLEKDITDCLLGSCNEAFQTRPVELLIAGLIHSFSSVFPERASPVVFNESHGRATWDDSIDLSETVGWFTSMFPIRTSPAITNNLLHTIRETKDCARRFPDNGWAYFASRFISQTAAQDFISMFPVEILFNYLGIYQQLERQDATFSIQPLPDGCTEKQDSAVRFSLFDFSAVVENGCVQVSVSYDTALQHRERISAWLQAYKGTLIEACSVLVDRSMEWTLTEFPLAFASYNDLHECQHGILPALNISSEDVEDIFPCSPIQQGILASQTRDASAYRVEILCEVTLASGSPVDVDRLCQAWKGTVRRHQVLRSLLVDNIPGSTGFSHIVLKDPEPSIHIVRVAGSADNATMEQLQAQSGSAYSHGQPRLEHQFTIGLFEDGRVFVRLDINHTILDAQSRNVILYELRAAYSKDLSLQSAPFKNVVSYLKDQSHDESRGYWTEHLRGAEPCIFPTLAEARPDHPRESAHEKTINVPNLDAGAMHAFCQQWEVTPATVFQLAWALILARYTGLKTVCFGNLTSGRDLPIDNVNSIVGPLINMLTCRVDLVQDRDLLDTLRSMQDTYVHSLQHQTFPLIEVNRALGLDKTGLFNTAFSFQRLDPEQETQKYDLIIRAEESRDPTEVKFMLLF